MASPVRARPTVLPPDDAALIVRIQRGDERAFDELFRTYYGPLCGFALLHLGGVPAARVAAEDIVQDLFAQLWSRRTAWEVTTHVRAYLYTGVLNRARNHHRTAGRAIVELGEVDVGVDCPAPDRSDAVVTANELAIAIRSAVAALPERAREIFLLNRHAELSYREIAVRLGVSVKTVEFHMGRALICLRDSLAAWR